MSVGDGWVKAWPQPMGLTDVEVHALLRAAGALSHGLAARNYAIVQLVLQAGLRVGEVEGIASVAR
jgi:integrase